MKPKNSPNEKKDRNMKLLHAYNDEPYQPLRVLAEQFGITEERIRQILRRWKQKGMIIRPRLSGTQAMIEFHRNNKL